jgi:hypothetical protein
MWAGTAKYPGRNTVTGCCTAEGKTQLIYEGKMYDLCIRAWRGGRRIIPGGYFAAETITCSGAPCLRLNLLARCIHAGFCFCRCSSGAVRHRINIENATNGEDADTPPGPTLPVGSTADFTYVVRNTGNIPLTNVTVTDDQGVIVTCPSGNPIPLLRRGRSETCTCTGSATVSPGQYTHRGSATGTAPDGSLYSDNDPSHHFGGPANTNPRDIPTLSMLGLGLLALLLGSGVSMFRNIGRPR